jgi:hypothetical protein
MTTIINNIPAQPDKKLFLSFFGSGIFPSDPRRVVMGPEPFSSTIQIISFWRIYTCCVLCTFTSYPFQSSLMSIPYNDIFNLFILDRYSFALVQPEKSRIIFIPAPFLPFVDQLFFEVPRKGKGHPGSHYKIG